MRKALLVVNASREAAVSAAEELSPLLIDKGFSLVTFSEISIDNVSHIAPDQLDDIEVAIVLGGDGTILRAAEVVEGRNIPILGINLGHVGFLAEVEKPSISAIADAIADKTYISQQRLTVAYSVLREGSVIAQGWALNEVTIEREQTTMVELFVEIDQRPLSRWGSDGLICATPTGSTAYAFSAGGPVVWPEVNALVLLPISAHALFSRPMVVSPDSIIEVTIESAVAQLSADALRKVPLLKGDRIRMTRNESYISLAHIKNSPFTDRLVAKFKLPVEGWRGE
jgi:NAD+ kinase